ncbi:hypothetical protein EDB86DRAFT_2833566 [Lactarius hatsudake]|nr:hypothetical protein EDB86DRAFT_2833566 [Lactarius hatsudake]
MTITSTNNTVRGKWFPLSPAGESEGEDVVRELRREGALGVHRDSDLDKLDILKEYSSDLTMSNPRFTLPLFFQYSTLCGPCLRGRSRGQGAGLQPGIFVVIMKWTTSKLGKRNCGGFFSVTKHLRSHGPLVTVSRPLMGEDVHLLAGNVAVTIHTTSTPISRYGLVSPSPINEAQGHDDGVFRYATCLATGPPGPFPRHYPSLFPLAAFHLRMDLKLIGRYLNNPDMRTNLFRVEVGPGGRIGLSLRSK